MEPIFFIVIFALTPIFNILRNKGTKFYKYGPFSPKMCLPLINPILHTWFRDSCFTCDGFSTIQVFPLLFHIGIVPRARVKKTKARPDCSSAPTQLALCLRFASMYKGESCYALQPSMTRLHNAELVN
jgi:hypothetical protein